MQDGNGMVSTSEIKFVLTRLGVELTDEELGEMVQVIFKDTTAIVKGNNPLNLVWIK